jgi:hypothetical protein
MKIDTFIFAALTVCLIFPALIAKGTSQFPIWAVVLFLGMTLQAHNLHVRQRFIITILAVFIIFLIQVLFDDNHTSVAFYRLQILLSFVLAITLTKDMDEKTILTATTVAVLLNLSAVVGELFVPDFCRLKDVLNSVRSCVDGRPSGFYSEPSHIAFLVLLHAFLLLKSHKIGFNIQTLIIVIFATLTISGTFIAGVLIFSTYRVIKKLKFSSFYSLIITSGAYLTSNITYLYYRNNGTLPVQGSFDKRSTFSTNFLDLERLVPNISVWPTNEIFYANGLYPNVMENNPEILLGYSKLVPAMLSPISLGLITFGWPIGLLIILLLFRIVSCKRYPEFVLIFWLGFPASLSVLPFIVVMMKKNKYYESNFNNYT